MLSADFGLRNAEYRGGQVVRPCEGAVASHAARQNHRALRYVVYRQSDVSVVVYVEKKGTALCCSMFYVGTANT